MGEETDKDKDYRKGGKDLRERQNKHIPEMILAW